jgi:hypothetical protein
MVVSVVGAKPTSLSDSFLCYQSFNFQFSNSIPQMPFTLYNEMLETRETSPDLFLIHKVHVYI